MPHSYNKDLGTVAMLRKCAPDIIGPDKWRGPSEADLDLRIHHHKCSFCGLPMSPYKDYGNALIWKCDNEFCPNNPDCKLKASHDFTGVDFRVLGNPDLRWEPWNIHRVA